MTDEIIGREDELAVIDALLDRPIDSLRTIVLEGEAGIGKSTLWQAAVARARARGLRILVSRPAEAERTLPYVVLGDLFADTDETTLANLEAPRRRAFESALLRTDADLPVDPRALGVAIHSIVPILARSGPLVLAIDDVQWTDPSSTATLAFAIRRALDQPVLLLLSKRLDGAPTGDLEAALGTAAADRLHVGPLSVGAIQLLLRTRLGVSFPRPTLVRLHEACGGNPFYAIELARARSMDPTLDPTAPIAVPPNLERLVAARLDSLAPPARRMLLLVAAHGRMPVDLRTTLGISKRGLDSAQAANIIEVSAEAITFTHPLLASAVYQGVPDEQRRAAHRRLAAALEDPVERGRHLALASGSASDPLAAELESAAVVARERGMSLVAAELAEHALRLTPPERPDDRHHRAIAAARAHLDAGSGGRARAIAGDVMAWATPGIRRAEALILASETEDVGPAVRLLEEALTEAAGIPRLEAAIHARLGGAGRGTKGRAWSEPHAREALRLAELIDDPSLRAESLLTLAVDRFEGGDPQGIELVERAYALVASSAQPDRMGWADSRMGWVLMFSSEYARAREWLRPRLEYWRDRDEQMRSELLWLMALTEFWSGRWTLADEYANQVRDINLQYEEVSTDHLSPALIALHSGRFDVARDHSRRALSLARGHLLPQHKAILGICDLWGGNTASALAHLVDADQTADVRGWDEPNIRWWRADLAEALMQLGRLDEAGRLLDDWESAANRVGRGRSRVHVGRSRGLLAAAWGDLTGALDQLEWAASGYASIGDPFNRGRALLALGVVRLRARQKQAARTALATAIATFDALGAVGWAATARTELARVGGRQRIEGLSPSEHRVAELVIEGRTNREIASTLFLGERTVASHLTHIYAKLGVRSRTELARQMLPGGERSAEIAGKTPTS